MRVVVCFVVLLMAAAVARQGVTEEGTRLAPTIANPACTCILFPIGDPDAVTGYQEFWTEYNHLNCNQPASGALMAMEPIWPQFCFEYPDGCDCLGGGPADKVNFKTYRVEPFLGLDEEIDSNHDPVGFVGRLGERYRFPPEIKPPTVLNDGDGPQYFEIRFSRDETRIYQVHKIRYHLGGMNNYKTIHLGKEYRRGDRTPINVLGVPTALDVNGRHTMEESAVHRLTDGWTDEQPRRKIPPMVLLSRRRGDGKANVPEKK